MRLPARPSFRVAAATVAVVLGAVAVCSQVFGGPVSYVIVSGTSMEPTMHTGDLALILEHSSYRPGEVVAFRVPAGEPGAGGIVIHRIIGGSDRGYLTQGDNREGRDPWRPKPDDVIGKMAFHVPKVGRAPMLLGSPFGLGLAAAVFAFVSIAGAGATRRRPPGADAAIETALEPGLEPPVVEPQPPAVAEAGRAHPLVVAAAALSIVALAVLTLQTPSGR